MLFLTEQNIYFLDIVFSWEPALWLANSQGADADDDEVKKQPLSFSPYRGQRDIDIDIDIDDIGHYRYRHRYLVTVDIDIDIFIDNNFFLIFCENHIFLVCCDTKLHVKH